MSYSADQGNQHNNGPHQDHTFNNPSALSLALWAKHRIRLRVGRWWEGGYGLVVGWGAGGN